VNQGGGLARLAGRLAGELLRLEPAQLVVYEGRELLGGVRVAAADGRRIEPLCESVGALFAFVEDNSLILHEATSCCRQGLRKMDPYQFATVHLTKWPIDQTP
jgi:hypothetical protein